MLLLSGFVIRESHRRPGRRLDGDEDLAASVLEVARKGDQRMKWDRRMSPTSTPTPMVPCAAGRRNGRDVRNGSICGRMRRRRFAEKNQIGNNTESGDLCARDVWEGVWLSGGSRPIREI